MKKARRNRKHNHSRVFRSCHGAGAAVSDKLTHGSGLKSSYCVWGCGLIIPVTGHVEQVVPQGWRMKQQADGFGETVKEKHQNKKKKVLVLEVSSTESPISPVWKKPSHRRPSNCETALECEESKTLDVPKVLLYKDLFPEMCCIGEELVQKNI